MARIIMLDWFDKEEHLTHQKELDIIVDEIYGENKQYHRFQPMFSIKHPRSDADSPYIYRHDGYEIDEHAWLMFGDIQSTNPDWETRYPKY
jgi:hypothetical protein